MLDGQILLSDREKYLFEQVENLGAETVALEVFSIVNDLRGLAISLGVYKTF